MKTFLIVKTSAIGDVIQSFPVLSYLKKRFPKCSIDWVVEKSAAKLLQAHPDIDNVFVVDTKLWRKSLIQHRETLRSFQKEMRKKNYDALFDLQGNTKSGLITAFAKARKKVGYSWKNLPEKTNYFATNVHLSIVPEGNVRSGYLNLVQKYFGDEEPMESDPCKLKLQPNEENRLNRLAQLGFQRPRLMICFGSNWSNKQLCEKALKEFLRLIDEKLAPTFFFVYGNEKEKKLADELERLYSPSSHAVGEMSLPLWQRFMGLVEGVISVDSAALHLCGTTQTPSFSIFGPSSASAYKPLGERHYAFQGSCPYESQFEKRCSLLRTCETGACMKQISPEALFEAFNRFWMSHSPALTMH